LTAQSVSPERLSIAGSETRVASITRVQTDTINLHSLTKSGDYPVDAFVEDPQVHFESPPQVTVHLTIEPTGK
jgi:YbbR domain-containing protein